MGAIIYYIVFGLLTAAGGIMGWVKARSMPSLVAGIGSGIILIAAGLIVPRGGNTGHWIAATVSALLLARFGPAWVRGKPMPGAPMTVLSVLGLVVSSLSISG